MVLRVVLFLSAIVLIKPGLTSDVIGISIILSVLIYQYLKKDLP